MTYTMCVSERERGVCVCLSDVQSVEELLRTCQTSQLEQELVNKYILIEDYFMRESLTKAGLDLTLALTALSLSPRLLQWTPAILTAALQAWRTTFSLFFRSVPGQSVLTLLVR